MSMELEINPGIHEEAARKQHRETVLAMARQVLENDVSDALDGVDDKFYALFLPSLEEQMNNEGND